MDNQKRKASVALLSVVSNSTLVALKLVIGILIGSVSVISEAIHSGVDLLAATIALFAVRSSGKPADKEHPFGHGKIENISGTIEALLIFLAAAWIIYEAMKKLAHPEPLDAPVLGVVVMLVSAVANIVVSQRLFKVGRETESVALQADAWHLRTDVYTSAGVMIGLAVIFVGRQVAPGFNLQWIDPVAAILVALLIIKAAYDLTVESGRDLLDISLPDDEEKLIKGCIAARSSDILGFHGFRTRKAGSDRFVEFHLLVRSDMSVDESHQITDEITNDVRDRLPGARVNIHIEPCIGECTAECFANCTLPEEQRKASAR